MHKNRPQILLVVIVFLFGLIFARLSYLHLLTGGKLARSASAQRISSSQVELPRGDIYDRNKIPLTNRNKKVSIALKPLYLRNRPDDSDRICDALQLNREEVIKDIEAKRQPVIIESSPERAQEVMKLNIEGVTVIHSLKRYDDSSVARHVLGYLNGADKFGETGIEKHYESQLKYRSENSMSVYTDARSNLIEGLGYRIIRSNRTDEKTDIILTLDYHIQKIVEEVLDRNNVTGAVVVEEVSTGDILAMSSKPDFDQNNIGRYLFSPGNELFNRAVASYNLGSIFKIVVSASACETGKTADEAIDCTGMVSIGDKEFRCTSFDRGGHGIISFSEAFALSCNSYFINTGINLGSSNIIGMAERFGMGKITGIKEQGVDESSGNVPAKGRFYTDGDIANISIGQGNILATPLQVADLVATVANGGIKNSVNIVDSIVDANGIKIKDIRRKEGVRVITKNTSNKIRTLMERVTSSGTGINAGLEEFGGTAGKTGSAETGQFINGEKVVHAWFAGYFPRRDPRYSVAVFIENGKSGSAAAVPVFAEIAEEIMKKGY